MRRIVSAAAGLALVAGGAALSAVPAEAASGTICASNYGSGLKYDTDYSNGYSWHTFSKGSCQSWGSKKAYQTTGKSIALVSGLYGVKCVNTSTLRIGDPKGYQINVQGYPKVDCKN